MLKYTEFITESKKDDCVAELKKMLKKKPKISDRGKPSDKHYNDYSKSYPDVKGIYPLSSIKKYLKDAGFTSDNVDSAINVLQNDKEFKLKSIKVKDYLYGNELVPHFYVDLTSDEAKEIKKDLEAKSKEMNADKVSKRSELKKSAEKNTKGVKSKKK